MTSEFFKFFILLVIFFALSSCDDPYNHLDEKTKIRLSTQKKAIKIVKKKHSLYATGLGYIGPDNYESLDVSFECNHLLSEDEARYLIVDIAGDFLKAINSSEDIRPYLCQYPYLPENLDIVIFPKKPNYEKPIHPDFVLINLRNGKINFKTEVEGQIAGYHSVKTESFEEALEKLRKQGRLPEHFKDYPFQK